LSSYSSLLLSSNNSQDASEVSKSESGNMDDLEREYAQRLEDFNQENDGNFEAYEKTS